MIVAVTHAFPIIPFIIILGVAVLFIAFAVVVMIVWDREPWWRKTPKPKRQYKDDKEQVKDWKLKMKYPKAFEKDSNSK